MCKAILSCIDTVGRSPQVWMNLNEVELALKPDRFNSETSLYIIIIIITCDFISLVVHSLLRLSYQDWRERLPMFMTPNPTRSMILYFCFSVLMFILTMSRYQQTEILRNCRIPNLISFGQNFKTRTHAKVDESSLLCYN